MDRREGDPGTWSHCGNSEPHAPHLHTVVFNEGPYPDVQCNGTPGPAQKVVMEHREVKHHLVDPEDIPAFEAGGWRVRQGEDPYEYGRRRPGQEQVDLLAETAGNIEYQRSQGYEIVRRLKAGAWHKAPEETL